MSKTIMTIKRFRFRIKPHPIMKSEYPDLYYKFRNEKVANAFFLDSGGSEHTLITK